MVAYVCPDCKSPLLEWACARCRLRFDLAKAFPVLLSHDRRFGGVRAIADAYETIYAEHANAWENQGRSPALVSYVASLVNRHAPRRVLEVGCGEGLLLGAMTAPERYGTDLSVHALERARARGPAELSVAVAERLPFGDATFDVVASVGVMEHFIDDVAASREICRVLRAGGHYVALLHLRMTTGQRLRQKVSEYVFPRPRPVALARWLTGKVYRPIRQPVQNAYTLASARRCLEASGLAVREVIDTRTTPHAPLVGPHVVVYVCEKPGGTPA